MHLIAWLVWLAAVGVGLYLVNTLMPSPAWIKAIINFVAAVFVFLSVLQMLGFQTGIHLRL